MGWSRRRSARRRVGAGAGGRQARRAPQQLGHRAGRWSPGRAGAPGSRRPRRTRRASGRRRGRSPRRSAGRRPDSSLICRAMPRPPAGVASPSSTMQVDLVVVDQPDRTRRRSTRRRTRPQVGRRPGADGQPHPVADLRVVAVEQDGVQSIAHAALGFASCCLRHRTGPVARWLTRAGTLLQLDCADRTGPRDVPAAACRVGLAAVAAVGRGAGGASAASSRSSSRSTRRASRSDCSHPLHDQHARAWSR